MNRIGIGIAVSAVLAGLSQTVGIAPVEAAQLTFNIAVDIQSGSLFGETLTGVVSVREAAVSGAPFEEIGLDRFSFLFDNTEYTEADDPFAFAEFENGSLSGLSYAAFGASALDPIFTFETFLGAQFFDYTDPFSQANDGSGDVRFVQRNPPQVIPEPTSTLGLILLLGASRMLRRSREQ
ncbi:MAG: PEP-CTERM sorting domain-containing protein [Cyanobacteria bacterium J06639_1]